MAEFRKKYLESLLVHKGWLLNEKYLLPGKIANKYSCENYGEMVIFDDAYRDVKTSNSNVHIRLSKQEYKKLIKHVEKCNQENHNKALDKVFNKLKRVEKPVQRNSNS